MRRRLQSSAGAARRARMGHAPHAHRARRGAPVRPHARGLRRRRRGTRAAARHARRSVAHHHGDAVRHGHGDRDASGHRTRDAFPHPRARDGHAIANGGRWRRRGGRAPTPRLHPRTGERDRGGARAGGAARDADAHHRPPRRGGHVRGPGHGGGAGGTRRDDGALPPARLPRRGRAPVGHHALVPRCRPRLLFAHGEDAVGGHRRGGRGAGGAWPAATGDARPRDHPRLPGLPLRPRGDQRRHRERPRRGPGLHGGDRGRRGRAHDPPPDGLRGHPGGGRRVLPGGREPAGRRPARHPARALFPLRHGRGLGAGRAGRRGRGGAERLPRRAAAGHHPHPPPRTAGQRLDTRTHRRRGAAGGAAAGGAGGGLARARVGLAGRVPPHELPARRCAGPHGHLHHRGRAAGRGRGGLDRRPLRPLRAPGDGRGGAGRARALRGRGGRARVRGRAR